MMEQGLRPLHDKETAAERKQIRNLEKELLRKDKALAEAAAIIILQKKISELFPKEEEF